MTNEIRNREAKRNETSREASQTRVAHHALDDRAFFGTYSLDEDSTPPRCFPSLPAGACKPSGVPESSGAPDAAGGGEGLRAASTAGCRSATDSSRLGSPPDPEGGGDCLVSTAAGGSLVGPPV